MLNLYYGREDIDKNKFMFQQIRHDLERCRKGSSEAGRILLIVPDQYTLQAEREAFSYMDAKGLLELDIVSQSRLGHRIVNEVGGRTRLHIDKYGRHIVLTRIISELQDQLEAFSSVKKSHAFIEMANDLLTEMKQYKITAEDLAVKLKELPEDSILLKKLEDLEKIYSGYEARMQGKYMDNEDYVALVAQQIQRSQKIAESEIWITGFHSFTPNSLHLLEELICRSPQVNLVMTGDYTSPRDREIFALPHAMIGKIRYLAERNQVPWNLCQISQEFAYTEKHPQLRHLERELYAYPQKPYQGESVQELEASLRECEGEPPQSGIAFCQAANYYSEAETAAAEIVRLVREQNLRYRDIGVICNDLESRGSVIKRVFTEYGIPVFLDCKRSMLHNPVVVLVLSLLDTVENNWSFDDVFGMVKTGLLPQQQMNWEELENYALQYKIRGNGWKRPFKYGTTNMEQEQLEALENMRQFLSRLIEGFEREWKEEKNVEARTISLYRFLEETLRLPARLQQLQEELVSQGQLEPAEEIGQTWAVTVGLLEQLVELLGQEKITAGEYGQLLRCGFESIEIGLLPPSEDQIVVGTMQRTRAGQQKALLVLGANDGLLPASPKDKALLNDDERLYLLRSSIEICKDDTLRQQEEQLAIYKALTVPQQYLWISFAATDLEGKECKSSLIYQKLRKLFPQVSEQKDICNRNTVLDLTQNKAGAMIHLTEAMEQVIQGKELSSAAQWKSVYNWLLREASSREELDFLHYGLLYDNKAHRLDKRVVNALYKAGENWELVVSPSRLERFGRCPFSHFIQYGLRPEERRIFEVAGREVGDAYHECLMRLSQDLTRKGVPVTAPESPWMQITQQQCYEKIQSMMQEISQEYREGILEKGEEERYRTQRMADVCGKAAWALVSHVQAGTIENIYFEAEFGRGASRVFPPVVVEARGHRVCIEGKIDRVDVLAGEQDSYVKIIDYKSGREKFDMQEAKSGWRLQLMLYLEAALGSFEKAKKQAKPAGVFYFEIAEPMAEGRLSAQDLEQELQNQLLRRFKMDGIVLDNPVVIDSLDRWFDGHSAIIPVQRKKDGSVVGSSENKLLDEEAFLEFSRDVRQTIEQLCTELAEGAVDIEPKRTKNNDACRYCSFKGICQFDTMFSGCKYR